MNDEKPTGVIVTLSEMYGEIQRLGAEFSKLSQTVTSDIESRKGSNYDSRLRKLEQQNAAHWVVHTIIMGAVALGVERLFS